MVEPAASTPIATCQALAFVINKTRLEWKNGFGDSIAAYVMKQSDSGIQYDALPQMSEVR